MKLEPLPKEITYEIRFILEGYRDGRLKYDQTNYSCGTAHCIAGWKCAFDAATAKKKDREAAAHLRPATVSAFANGDEWGYAQDAWGLSDTEADVLFRIEATLPEQFELLKAMEAGRRLI